MIYNHYIINKSCVEFSVEEPSDEFQSRMDLIEVALIWQHTGGFFGSIKNLLRSGKRHQFITRENFDTLSLPNEEILRISKALKLTK
jgi:hypothetical protein